MTKPEIEAALQQFGPYPAIVVSSGKVFEGTYGHWFRSNGLDLSFRMWSESDFEGRFGKTVDLLDVREIRASDVKVLLNIAPHLLKKVDDAVDELYRMNSDLKKVRLMIDEAVDGATRAAGLLPA